MFIIEKKDGGPFELYKAVFSFSNLLGVTMHGEYADESIKHKTDQPKEYSNQTYKIRAYVNNFASEPVGSEKILQAIKQMDSIGYKVTEEKEEKS